ncbi:MAG: hypothetical protein KAH04_05030 [Psychrilyobacter sp.]|nr:hypothetical protein [Psychrilyobacter sp.]
MKKTLLGILVIMALSGCTNATKEQTLKNSDDLKLLEARVATQDKEYKKLKLESEDMTKEIHELNKRINNINK